jgi:predicted enzyme related to lactoylglutathione lyase
MNHFSFIEIPTVDLKKAQTFFGRLFDWKFEPLVGYRDMMMINTGQEPGGLLYKVKSIPKKHSVLVHIEVQSIDEKLKQIRKARGKVVLQKTPILNLGWFAYFATPDGCTLALWEPQRRAA